MKAGVLVVMAKTPPKIVNGKERKQITAFIVDVDSPGLEITHRCHFMGLRALYNGVVSFTDVRVPRENIMSAEGKGLKVALTTLNTGRLTIPAACVGLSQALLEICRKWAAERVQWGVPIGQHSAIAGKDRGDGGQRFRDGGDDVSHLRLGRSQRRAICASKPPCARCGRPKRPGASPMTRCRSAADAVTKRRNRSAARGEEPIAVERFLRDCRINTIFEGSSEIMRLFIAREALDPHLKVGGAIFNTQLPMADADQIDVQLRDSFTRVVSEAVVRRKRGRDQRVAR